MQLHAHFSIRLLQLHYLKDSM